jgi:hypothetical protein
VPALDIRQVRKAEIDFLPIDHPRPRSEVDWAHDQIDPRRLGSKAAQERWRQAHVKRARKSNAKRAFRCGRNKLVGSLQFSLDSLKRGHEVGVERFGTRRGHNALARSHKKLVAEENTQPLERVADGRLAEEEALARSRG